MQNHRLDFWRPDRPSPHHKKYTDHFKLKMRNLPPQVDMRSGFPPAFDQKNLGSCTMQAWCKLLDFIQLADLKNNTADAEVFEPGKYDPISRLFGYYTERFILGDVEDDSGAELSTGVQAIETIGFCRESLWPYHESKFQVKPPQEAWDEAAKHKDHRCYKLKRTQLKAALAAGMPFVCGLILGQSFMSDEVAQNGMIPMFKLGEPEAGGHAILIGGYDDSVKVFPESKGSYLLGNSWGAWGLNGTGWAYLPQEYLESTELSTDFWTVKRSAASLD